MKKALSLTFIFSLIFSFSSVAIGLPNNAFIQQKVENENIHFIKTNPTKVSKVSSSLVISKIDSENKEETNGQNESFATYLTSMVTRIVNFLTMTIIGVFSSSHAVANELNALHTWMFLDVPPQC